MTEKNAAYKQVRPYDRNEHTKKTEVAEMFDRISPSYDFLNHFLSLGIDRWWRKKVIDKMRGSNPQVILDVATGTADLAIDMHRHLKPASITGVDISQKMLDIGVQKIKKKNIDSVTLIYGDSENLPFADEHFDAVTAAFGVRNFEHPIKGLSEMHRTLKIGGKVYILEFSTPKGKIFGPLYQLYFKYVLPTIGRLLSKDRRAYTYLQESVGAFPDFNDFVDMMKDAGFIDCTYDSLTFGICCIYSGRR